MILKKNIHKYIIKVLLLHELVNIERQLVYILTETSYGLFKILDGSLVKINAK